MKKINIKNQNSTIYIGEKYQNIKKYLPKKKCFLVCDENIYKHYAAFIDQFPHIIIGCGEENKNWNSVENIIEQLLKSGADRNSFLIGMGGGLVCDITGFAASIFMRGVDFAFISTSLLSQVDASVGGKNGVNFGKLKNMLGVFNPPQFVICDPYLLHSLPPREINSGFGEIIKHAFIKDTDLVDFLLQNKEALLQLDTELMEKLIYRAVSIKANVVENDPLEKGERKILNFGHTIGHAIENNSDLTHGEAVAVGMIAASELSEKICNLSSGDKKMVRKLIEAYKLPIQFDISNELLKEYLAKDKKKNRDSIDFILLEKIGKACIYPITIKELNAKIDQL